MLLIKDFGRHDPDVVAPLSQGDDANRVLMVKDGEAVAVGIKGSDEEVEVRVYRPLDFFGDGTIVKGRAHTASVRARTKCTVSLTIRATRVPRSDQTDDRQTRREIIWHGARGVFC